MFSFSEFHGQSSLDKHGTIELNTSYVTRRKPLWLVVVKLVALAAMVGVAGAVLMPTLGLWMPPWKAGLASAGIVLIYIGVAFFFRPQCNGDNMGWFGGMANDPFQYSDNINRALFQLHMVLGPGRFAAETLLDACAVVGLARGAEVIDKAEAHAAESAAAEAAEAAERPMPRADRFDQPRGGSAWE